MGKKSNMLLIAGAMALFVNGFASQSLSFSNELEQKIESFAKRAENGEWEAGLLGETTVPIDEKMLKQMKSGFNAAVKESKHLGPDAASHKLAVVVPWNKDLIWSKGKTHVLVASWMALPIMRAYYLSGLRGYQTTSNDDRYLMWVTLEPTLKEFAKKYRPSDNNGLPLHYRLNQLLGLTPDTRAKYFVRLWVRPEDLMRACVDSGVVDSTCVYDAAHLNAVKPGGSYDDIYNFVQEGENHKTWYKKQRADQAKDASGFPWTSLGYTYDWGSKTKEKFGVSEFIIKPNSSVYIQQIAPTDAYANSADIPSGEIEVQRVGRVK